MSAAEMANQDVFYQRRAESLLSVDEGIQSLMQAVASNGFTGNTIVIFTSDQGESQGEHSHQTMLSSFG